MRMMTVHFQEALQNSQNIGGDEHMTADISGLIAVDGKPNAPFTVSVKQIVGSEYEKEPVEVGVMQGYSGPLDRAAFAGAVDQYYRLLVGSTAVGIRTRGGGGNIRMMNNRFAIPFDAHIPMPDESGGPAGW